MDIRAMMLEQKIQDNEDVKVSVVPVSAYVLSEDCLKILRDRLDEMRDMEFWDPMYQAWLPFARIYLQSGADPDMALKYLQNLKRWDADFEPHDCSTIKAFNAWQRMQRAHTAVSASIPFEDLRWDDVDLLVKEGMTLNKNRRSIKTLLESDNELIKELNKLDQAEPGWDGLAHLTYAYCHTLYFDTSRWIGYKRRLEQIEEYKRVFVEQFDLIAGLLSGHGTAYDWYSPNVKACIVRNIDMALRLKKPKDVINLGDLFNDSPGTSEYLTAYINGLPTAKDISWDRATTWNALLLGSIESNTASHWDKFLIYTTLWSRVKTVIDSVVDLYWSIRDGSFNRTLISMKEEALKEGIRTEESVQDFIATLRMKGFPIGGI